MRLRYTLPALADLRSVLDYIADRSPQGAAAYIPEFAQSPICSCGIHWTDDPTIRRIATTPYPYLIFYEATDAEIIIHAVSHGAREPSDKVRSA
jgi:toxin ParE1/3/4